MALDKTGTPNARPTGGNALSQGFTIGTSGGNNPLGITGGLPFPTQTGNADQPVVQTGVSSTRFYKGGAVQVPLANPADVFTATMSAYQQALGRNPTPQEMQTVLDQVNAQIQAKGASDIATANAQTQSMVSIYQGGLSAGQGGASTNGPGAGPGGAATPQQVYQEVLALGGSVEQAQVGAALVSGIESDGSPTELAGGIGPAQGLFQFEPGTWTGNGGGKNGIPGSVGQASWQQQVQVFVNASQGNNFGAWGPDLGGSYGYSGPPMPGSKVANMIGNSGASWTGGGAPGIGQGMGAQGGGVQGGGVFSPVGAGLTQGRTDEGVDFGGSGALYAVGSGTILTTSGGNSWGGSSGTAPGGTFIALKLDHPPDPQHSVVYYAEDIAPNVSVGDHVNAGEMIGQATGTVGSGVEIGWGDPSGAPQALAHGQSGPTAEGQNFLSFISGASPGGGQSLSDLTPQQIKSLYQAAQEPGGAAYLRAMAAQSGGTGGLGQTAGGQPTVLQNSGGSQIVVTPPIENTYTQPASPADQALMDAIYGNPTQYQSNNLVNVFDTISQMLGAPKGQPFQQALSVP